MQDEPIDGDAALQDDEEFERLLLSMHIEHAVLHLMLDPKAAPVWTVRELGLALRSDVFAEEAVRTLAASGLVHRRGEFVFPTQAAVRFRQLAAGS